MKSASYSTLFKKIYIYISWGAKLDQKPTKEALVILCSRIRFFLPINKSASESIFKIVQHQHSSSHLDWLLGYAEQVGSRKKTEKGERREEKWSSVKAKVHVSFSFFSPDVDTTKDPCQKVKCSRHKVCIAQGYQRAVCVNRKKLEHRWVCVAHGQELTNSQNRKIVKKKIFFTHTNMSSTQPSTHSIVCCKLECLSLSATLVVLKLVCAPV